MQQEMIVVIPIDAFKAILTKCGVSRPEYALLKTGAIGQNSPGNEQGKGQVEIICDSEGAKQIVDFVANDCPELSSSVIVISPAPRAV
jgi:hypothetical protein